MRGKLTRGAASIPSWLDVFHLYLPLVLLFVLVRFFCHRHKATAVVVVACAGAGIAASAVRTKAVEDVHWRLSGVQDERGLLSAIWDTTVIGGRQLV